MLAQRIAAVDLTWSRERCGTTPREHPAMKLGVLISGIEEPSRLQSEMEPNRGPN